MKLNLKVTNGGVLIPILVLWGLAVVQLLATTGIGNVGVNLGALEPVAWLGVGAFVFFESVIEDGKRLGKTDLKSLFTAVEAIVAVLWVAYGIAQLMAIGEWTQALSQYKAILLAVGVLAVPLEVFWL